MWSVSPAFRVRTNKLSRPSGGANQCLVPGAVTRPACDDHSLLQNLAYTTHGPESSWSGRSSHRNSPSSYRSTQLGVPSVIVIPAEVGRTGLLLPTETTSRFSLPVGNAFDLAHPGATAGFRAKTCRNDAPGGDHVVPGSGTEQKDFWRPSQPHGLARTGTGGAPPPFKGLL